MIYNRIPKKIVKIILLYLFTSNIIFLTACQSTPASEVVVNKNNSNLEEKVLYTPVAGEEWTNTNTKLVWNEKKSVDTEIVKCTITVSMDVDMPKYPGPVPIYLIEPAEFSLECYKTIVNYLMLGEIYDGRPSKQDIMLEIFNAKKLLSEHTITDRNQGEIDNYYNYLNDKYNNADENDDAAKFEFVENEYGQNALRIKSYLDDGTITSFTGKHSSFIFRVNDLNTIFFYSEKTSGINLQANGLKTTYEQALAVANKAMTSLFDKPYAMVHASIADKKNDLEYLWCDEETSIGQSYIFYYTPEYDGFPSLYIDQASRVVTEKTEYAKPYTREYALIIVDDRGIEYLTYESISDEIKKLNDNVKLMPFMDILELFKKDVFYHYIWGNMADIEITQIAFGMVREPVKDNPDQYMMVPAWSFIGNVKSDVVEEKGKSVLVLNAIDGSIITDYESICAPK